jgi:hypothetical protein
MFLSRPQECIRVLILKESKSDIHRVVSSMVQLVPVPAEETEEEILRILQRDSEPRTRNKHESRQA